MKKNIERNLVLTVDSFAAANQQ